MTMAPPTDAAYGIPDLSSQYNAALQSDQNSSNPFTNVLGDLGASTANQVATGQEQQNTAEAQYGINNAATQIGNQYNNQLAGYQLGQLGINQQQLGIQGTGLQEQGTLQGIENPISQSQLVGSEAASGALNTKGSQQNQQELGAQQQYSSEELANAQKQLGLMSQSNGMSQQEVYNQLAYMTAQGDLQNYENPIQLLNTVAQVNEGGLTGVENALSPSFAAQGINPFAGNS